MKKSISLLLTIIVCFSMSISAFAADEDNFVIPKDIKETTITYQIDPNDVDGIQPFIWNTEERETNKQTAYTPFFTIPDRYFAYEITATSDNPSGQFSVALIDKNSVTIRSISGIADGSYRKSDWIDVTAGQVYQFKVTNQTNSYLKFTITYYSWK
ncbi:MAG: hypothetical protein HFG83_11350 [Dorea sp.]|jgi:hypothetical protein|nr:hypothetical protein [Dorea sp.]